MEERKRFIKLIEDKPNKEIYKLLMGVNDIFYDCATLLNALNDLTRSANKPKSIINNEYFFLKSVISDQFIIKADIILNAGKENKFQINSLVNKFLKSFPQQRDQILPKKKAIGSYENTVQNVIKKYRNNHISHLDENYYDFDEEFYFEFTLEVFKIIEEILDIINCQLCFPLTYRRNGYINTKTLFESMYSHGILK